MIHLILAALVAAANVFAPLAPSIKAVAAFPVLLPQELPDEGGAVYATVKQLDAESYTVEIDSRTNCRSKPDCTLGYVRASTSEISLSGDGVQLTNGTLAHFVPGTCAASCTLASLTWSTGTGFYRIALRAGEPDLVDVANSMAPY